VKDLLRPANGSSDGNNRQLNIEIREDPRLGMVLTGVEKFLVKNLGEVRDLIKMGNSRKKKSGVGSHTVTLVTVINPEKPKPTVFSSGVAPSEAVKKFSIGKICFADIGSRLDSISDPNGKNKSEALRLNRSLLALSSCIESLAKISNIKENCELLDPENGPKKKIFVPYRDSKLTRLLKDS
jgi:kinesin family protein 18/19